MRSFHAQGKKIIAVASNYRAHINEMASQAGKPHPPPMPSHPTIFLKPTSSYVLEPLPIRIPPNVRVEHEVELGVVIGRAGANIKIENAYGHIAGYSLALDLTARDLQTQAKKEGLPWTQSKGYDTFCPIGNYLSTGMVADHHQLDIWCRVNGKLRQKSNTCQMIWKVEELISYISRIMRLEVGDFILTGTPAGVGEIKVGDKITAGLGNDLVNMYFKCVPKPAVIQN